MLEVYKPHNNRKAVGVWLCFAAKRPSKLSALVYTILLAASMSRYNLICKQLITQ